MKFAPNIMSVSLVALGILTLATGCSTASAATQSATPTPTATKTTFDRNIKLTPEIIAVISKPKYKNAHWGILVTDRKTGETLYELNANNMFAPGSSTKLFTTAAALDTFGKDYRFKTPIYRRGQVNSAGELDGDLILVASGDLTMGGRDTADGRIDFTDFDHGDANVLPLATLTPEDPLQGLNRLAKQVAAAGIKKVNGDVLIDDRLFPQMEFNGDILTPIMINDNLIDLTIAPGKNGMTATVSSRPQTAMFAIKSDVKTVAAGQDTDIQITSPRTGEILVTGQIAADAKPLVRTYAVQDPTAFARTLLIEALQRAGIAVTAPVVAKNAADKLPKNVYSQENRVALLTSLPFSENIKLIDKVSQNYQANTLVMLIAAKNGKPGFEEGIGLELPFLQKAGVDTNGVSLGDGAGGLRTDLISPHAMVQLLRYMATRDDFRAYHDALPILGVDGTLATAVPANSPVRGKVYAKTGTLIDYDSLHDRPILLAKALAGYMTAASGRELVFNFVVNDVPINSLLDALNIGNELGTLAEIVYRAN